MKVDIGNYTKNDAVDRKIKIRIDSFDTWNADHTLALIIHPVLVQLRKQKSGIPGYLCRNKDGTEIPNDVLEKRWDDILDKMIYAFQQIKDGYPDDTSHSNNTYKFDKKYYAKINAGLRLFAKHYLALWT